MSDIFVNIRFNYDTDEEAKRGREEIVQIFDRILGHWYSVLRKHNKIDVDFHYYLEENCIGTAQTKIHEMFEKFKHDFPKQWKKCTVFKITLNLSERR